MAGLLSDVVFEGQWAEVADHRVLAGDSVHAVAVIELEGGGVPRIDGKT